MGHMMKSTVAAAALAALTSAFTGHAFAGQDYDRYDDNPGGYGHITAYASTGGKSVTAPVRPGRWGDEVKIPGGAWVDCEITCEYTLRRLTVDFWEGQGRNGFVSPGYFRYEYDLDTGETYRRGPALFGRY